MATAKQAHQRAANLHATAADLHTKAATAHVTAALDNRAAGNAPAAALDDKAAAQHTEAARQHTEASNRHQSTATKRGQSAPSKQKAGSVSQSAGNASALAGAMTQEAVAADASSTQQSTNGTAPPGSQDQVISGQIAKQLSDQAVQAGTQAAQTGQIASGTGTPDGGLINAIVQDLGLTGVTKTMVDHNRFFTLALLISVILVIVFVYFFGAEPTIDNPFYSSNAPAPSNAPSIRMQQQAIVAISIANDTSATGGKQQPIDAALDNDPDLAPIHISKYFPGKRVTAAELQSDLQNYLAAVNARITALQSDLTLKSQQVQSAVQQIEAQKAAISAALQTVSALAVASAPATGPIGPLIGVVTGLLTAGLAGDNARKSSVASQVPGAEEALE